VIETRRESIIAYNTCYSSSVRVGFKKIFRKKKACGNYIAWFSIAENIKSAHAYPLKARLNMEEEATLLSFNVRDLDDFLNLATLRHCLFAVHENILALATARHILLMEGTGPSDEELQNIQITDFESEYGYPLCIHWLNSEVIAVGFESGYLVLFDLSASVILERRFYDCPLVSLQTKDSTVAAVGIELWGLFERGYVFMVRIVYCLTSF
jgi:hypothetical protein